MISGLLLPLFNLALATVKVCQYWHSIVQHIQRAYVNLSWHYYKLRKRPPRSRPITSSLTASNNDRIASSFDRLPPEIRLQIYYYVFPDHRVIQPEFRDGKLCVRLGLLSTTSAACSTCPNYVRSDTDNTSEVLHMTLGDRGSFLHQTSHRIPSSKLGAGRLICGDGEAFYADQHPAFFGSGSYSGLLRTSRTVYQEVLDELYGRHTFSFFGPQMLRFFLENASIEGVKLIRYVHLAVPIPSRGNGLEKAKRDIISAMKQIAVEFASLRQLDVEFVLCSDAPSDPTEFWRWIKDEAFSQLQTLHLEKFVMKILVLQKEMRRVKLAGWETRFEPLSTWNKDDYVDLKAKLTGRLAPDH